MCDSMKLCKELIQGNTSLAVIGLGYVGISLAVAFASRVPVIGFDIDERKITRYRTGQDPTGQVGETGLRASNVHFTADPQMLREAGFFVVAVPTPVKADLTPDLSMLEHACRTIGSNMPKGAVIVFESTVYPGATEGVCIPALEESSGQKCGIDFQVGYSPERINPGDTAHPLKKIPKILSAVSEAALLEIRSVYELIIETDLIPVSSIRVAEMIKAAENSQRDVNIAFMNEMALLCHALGIDTGEVLTGMNTKWNALGFRPGLVGGHCIGVDPYYLAYQAARLGCGSRMITAGRQINRSMGRIIAEQIAQKLTCSEVIPEQARVVILGLTYKANCPDIRNSGAAEVVKWLRCFGINPTVVDPNADRQGAMDTYGIETVSLLEVSQADCILLAVAHREFLRLTPAQWARMLGPGPGNRKVIMDVTGRLVPSSFRDRGYGFWRL